MFTPRELRCRTRPRTAAQVLHTHRHEKLKQPLSSRESRELNLALAQHHDFHSAFKLFLTVIKYSALRSHIVSKGPLKILKEVLDMPSGKPKGQNGKGEPQKNGKRADLGVTERAGGQGGGVVNVSDYCISHEERHHAHHKCKRESDNRTHACVHTHTHTLVFPDFVWGTHWQRHSHYCQNSIFMFLGCT